MDTSSRLPLGLPPMHNNGIRRRGDILRCNKKGSVSDSEVAGMMGGKSWAGQMMTMSTVGGQNRMFTPAKRKKSSLSDKSRKSLQTLQPGAGRQTTLVGSRGLVRLDQNGTKRGKRKLGECESQPSKQAKTENVIIIGAKQSNKDVIYEDPEEESSTVKKPKTLAEEALELMVNESVPENYWKDVAEERRKALEETLKENEELHIKVNELETEVDRLSELAGQTEYFAAIVKELMNEKEEEEKLDEIMKEENTDREQPTSPSSHSGQDSDAFSSENEEENDDKQSEDEENKTNDEVFTEERQGKTHNDELRKINWSEDEQTTEDDTTDDV